MGLKHNYKSVKADPADSSIIGATKWNADHYFLDSSENPVGALGDLAYRGTDGLVSLVTGAQGLLFSAGSGNVPAYTMTPSITHVTITHYVYRTTPASDGQPSFLVGRNAADDAILPILNLTSGDEMILGDDGTFPGASVIPRIILKSGAAGFGYLAFGGSTSSFSMIKSGGATVAFRLADDSGHASITCGAITVGSTAISETDIAKIDGITNGTAAASKALVADSNIDIAGIRNVTLTGAYSATNATGTVLGNTSQVVANDAVISLGSDAVRGFVFVINHTDASQALFTLNGTGNAVGEVSYSASIYSITAGTSSRINIYWSAGNNRYELQNKRGSSVTISLIRIGI